MTPTNAAPDALPWLSLNRPPCTPSATPTPPAVPATKPSAVPSTRHLKPFPCKSSTCRVARGTRIGPLGKTTGLVVLDTSISSASACTSRTLPATAPPSYKAIETCLPTNWGSSSQVSRRGETAPAAGAIHSRSTAAAIGGRRRDIRPPVNCHYALFAHPCQAVPREGVRGKKWGFSCKRPPIEIVRAYQAISIPWTRATSPARTSPHLRHAA